MKRWASCALMVALTSMTVSGLAGTASARTPAMQRAATPKPVPPVVFVAPHQDDETLSMGAAIVNQVKSRGAKNVFVYLYTDGGRTSSTWLLSAFDGAVECGFWDAQGRCVRDARFSASSPQLQADTTTARDKEFVAAVSAFGVPRANIRMYSADDGGFCGRPESWQVMSTGHGRAPSASGMSPVAARQLLGGCVRPDAAAQGTADALWRQLAKKHGKDAAFRSMSDFDPSQEHRVLGIGLRKALRAGLVRDVAFYYPPYRRAQATYPVAKALLTEVAADQAKAKAGGLEYGVFDAAAGRFAIGFASVGYAFGAEACATRVLNRSGNDPLGTPSSTCGHVEKPVKCVGDPVVCSDYRYFTGRTLDGRYGPGKIHSLRHR